MNESHPPLSESTSDPSTQHVTPQAENQSISPQSSGQRFWFAIQFFGAIGITAAVLVYLLFFFDQHSEDDHHKSQPVSLRASDLAVEMVDSHYLRIDLESTFGKKLGTTEVSMREVTSPLLRVTGTIAASLRPIGENDQDQWQFNSPDALAAFSEWRSAVIDEQFAREQAQRIRQLNTARLTSRQTIVDRLKRLVAAGTDTTADLQLAETEYLEAEIEGREQIQGADSELRKAIQAVAVGSRQLQLMGLDVEMLEQASSDVDIIVADVPEAFQKRVVLGQQIEARFAAFPGEVFPGIVRRISPTLSLERRALRVLFYVDDPDDRLRPGMFADIALGTDPRQSVLVPATAVIHIGRDDFVLSRDPRETELWKITEVTVGDKARGEIEILSGLTPGVEIIGVGAILLKPVVASALREIEQGL